MTSNKREKAGCDIAHEKQLLEEYGVEVMSAGWIPPHTLKSGSGAGPAIAPAETSDNERFFLFTALPQCP